MKTNNRKFVIQKHSSPGDVHWDLMLEAGQVLETYRLALPPEQLLNQTTTAIRIADHPVKFLTYEGTVNKGAGTVEIAETGTYQVLSDNEGLRELQLDGKILKGKFTFIHIDAENWQLGRHYNPTSNNR
ncbi:MAG: DNA polymerase ligase N-terminal domain-containing protein [Planctomycetota bacterium]|jgi:bifunctional non-homologous end joining protein LigD